MDTLTPKDLAKIYRAILSNSDGDVKKAREDFETAVREYEQDQQTRGNAEK